MIGTAGTWLESARDRWRAAAERAGRTIGPRSLSWVVFVVFLALYVFTLRSEILPADSGELQRVAATAGVAHPPGYPLYTMMAWLFSRVPVGPSSAWRVNLFSAVTSAITLALAFRAAHRLTSSIWGALAAAVTLGSATTFWATATKASVRPLTAFFASLCLFALAEHAPPMEPERRVGDDRYLVLFFLALSLGVTHHPSLAFPGVVFVLYLVLVDPALLRQPKRWFKPLAALLPGLLVFVYLPLRGAPELATLSGVFEHVLARGFRGDMFALGLLDRLVLLPTLLGFQFSAPLVVGMVLGALALLWRDRKLALLLIGSFSVHAAVTLTYDAPQTVEYAMPAYVSMACLVAVPAGLVSELRSPREGAAFPVGRGALVAWLAISIVTLVLLVASGFNLAGHLPSYRRLAVGRDTREYVETVLGEAPEDAVILSNWHWFTPMKYVQEIEGFRPDVTVEYVAPRGEPLAETWVRSIEEHIGDAPVVVVRAFETQYDALPYRFEPLGEAFLVRSEPREDVPPNLSVIDGSLGGQVELLGYRLGEDDVRPMEPLMVVLAWSPATQLTTEVALFAHLIGSDGALWSRAEDPRHAPGMLSAGEVVVERFVVYPRLDAPPGPYTLAVGAYQPGGRLATPDGSDAIVLDTVDLKPAARRPVTEQRRRVRFRTGPTLIGVDYDVRATGECRVYLHWAGPGAGATVELRAEGEGASAVTPVPPLARGEYATVGTDCAEVPDRLAMVTDKPRGWRGTLAGSVRLRSPRAGQRYVPFGDAAVLVHASGPGDPLERGTEETLTLRFRAQRPLLRDYVVSTSLTGLNPDGTWAWRASHDTVPALGAIPTLKWIRGSRVLDPHRMRVPGDASAVPVTGSLLVYDHFTQRRLPHLADLPSPAVRLGTWRLPE